MKKLVSVVVLLVLAACQGSGRPEVAVAPLSGPVTFGTAPVRDVVQVVSYDAAFRFNGPAVGMHLDYKNRLSIEVDADRIQYVVTVEEADHWYRNGRPSGDSLPEQVAKLKLGPRRLRHEPGLNRTLVENGGVAEAARLNQTGDGLLYSLVMPFHHSLLAGRTVSQGEEVFRVGARDFVGKKYGSHPDERTAVGRVTGRALYNGRPVVVVEVVDEAEAEVGSGRFDGTFYVDIASGVPVHMTGTLLTLETSGSITRKMENSLDLGPAGG